MNTRVPFEVFDMAEEYEKVIFGMNVPMFPDYYEKKAQVMQIKNELEQQIDISKVPCHNDPLCENWVEGNGKMYLIDWEYAGMNDGMWDVADVSLEADFDEVHNKILLEKYLGRTPDVLDLKHFLANKCLLNKWYYKPMAKQMPINPI